MKDKKSFGVFIAERRRKLNLTQAELAEKLFVTKTAVSKWERGVTYPDITLISDLCKLLDVDEHELIAEGSSSEYRQIRANSDKYRKLNKVYFWLPTSIYLTALAVCFICNLAINHTLSWFFIVLFSLLTAFTLVPSPARFFPKFKLAWVSASALLSVTALLLTCCIYSGGSWFFIALFSVFLGYIAILLPVFAYAYPVPRKIKRHSGIICISADFLLVLALLCVCLYSTPKALLSATLTALFVFAPVAAVVAMFAYLKINISFKLSVLFAVAGVFAFFGNAVISFIFGVDYSFDINLASWQQENINGNIQFIILIVCLTVSLALLINGILKQIKKSRP